MSAKYKNLIRCGDINQAITTTFSNADVAGFRKFITENNAVNMNCSQRCTKEVWQLANNLVRWAKTDENMSDAFFEIFMQPVKDKNPISENAVKSEIFETYTEEKNYILNEIRQALKRNPKSTFGILLRSNYQVTDWLNFINNSGFTAITRSECLEQKSIYRVIYAVMNMILKPFDNNTVAAGYETLSELGFYKPWQSFEILKSEKPFIEYDFDNIENYWLSKFHFDLNYWLSFSHLAPEELAIKIGLYYFSSDIEKSNVYLISTLIKRLSVNYDDFLTLMERLKELAHKPTLSGFKFFSEVDESDKEFLQGKVQIMTLHKSKGDEFDYVFIPEFSENNLALDIENIKLKSSEFFENVKGLNSKYEKKSETELKKEALAENLRLTYVGITRAKRYLYITTSRKYKSYSSMRAFEPSVLFGSLLSEDLKEDVYV